MEGTKFGTIANQRQNLWIISLKLKHLVCNGLLFKLVTKSTCIKKESLLITNINNNLGDSVAEGTVSEPACQFQHLHGKIKEHL